MAALSSSFTFQKRNEQASTDTRTEESCAQGETAVGQKIGNTTYLGHAVAAARLEIRRLRAAASGESPARLQKGIPNAEANEVVNRPAQGTLKPKWVA
jgi:hypothetical protein